jgi:uncharacterized membrane protein required for colicin V production
VVLFGIIGAMRGWAKEMLVSFSVILALTFTSLLDHYVPFVRDVLQKDNPVFYFWLRTIILILLVFFGYQSPNIARFAPKMTREKFQDILLGAFLGAVNGYLIAGTIWFYLHTSHYPFPLITAPDENTVVGKAAVALLQYMAPRVLGIPAIYFAVVLAFIFVIVVFV